MSRFNESVTLVVIYLDHTPPAWIYHVQHQYMSVKVPGRKWYHFLPELDDRFDEKSFKYYLDTGACRPKFHAYKIIRGLNEELKAKGYRTISGKVPTKYFEEKFYGLTVAV